MPAENYISIQISLLQLVEPLYDNLRDTQMLAGSEAYTAALAYYKRQNNF